MFVHSCCCIWIFGWSGLIQIQNRIQNHLKMLWNIWKGKRKRDFILSLAFGLFSPARPQAHHRRGRLLPRAWVVSEWPFPVSPLGPSPPSAAAWLARAHRLPLLVAHWRVDPSLVSLTGGPHVSGHLLPSHTGAWFLSTVSPIETFLPNPFPS
jgi:hypothetical protein